MLHLVKLITTEWTQKYHIVINVKVVVDENIYRSVINVKIDI